MPDGTKTTIKPASGALYSQKDPQGNMTLWEWDSADEKWVNKSSGKPNSANTATFMYYPSPGINPIDLDNMEFQFEEFSEPQTPKSTKCECGSERVGSPRHSSWCSKYDYKQ